MLFPPTLIINVGGKSTKIIVGTNTVDNNFPEQRAQNDNLLGSMAKIRYFLFTGGSLGCALG